MTNETEEVAWDSITKGFLYFVEFRLNPEGIKNTLKDFTQGSNMIQYEF